MCCHHVQRNVQTKQAIDIDSVRDSPQKRGWATSRPVDTFTLTFVRSRSVFTAAAAPLVFFLCAAILMPGVSTH